MEIVGEPSDIILLKHLRAEQGHVHNALVRLEKTLVFRAEEGIDELAELSLADLGEKYAAAGVFGGTDVKGRPVVVALTPVGQDAESMLSDVAAFVRFNFWLKEQAFKRIPFAQGAPEDMCQMVDLSAVKFGPPPRAVSESSKIFKMHCPECNGVNIFVNVPSFVPAIFKMCRRFIDPRTFEKIRFCRAGEHRELFELVPPESLPVILGGMLQDPPGPLKGPCVVAEVQTGATEEVTLLVVQPMRTTVHWEVRSCSDQASSFEIVFSPTGDGEKHVVVASALAEPLQASLGVVSGEWHAPGAGTLTCRFSARAEGCKGGAA